MHDELAILRREVILLRREVRRQRHRRRFASTMLALSLALVPLGIFAAGFTDLNADSPHNVNINAIAAAGITKGCNPPTNDNYCPNDLVTREQMASFLARAAGLGDNPPVAKALTATLAESVIDGAITPAKLSIPTGTIIGYLAQESSPGATTPTAGVTVYVSGVDAAAITDVAGKFVLAGIPLGRWTVTTTYLMERTSQGPNPGDPVVTLRSQCVGTIANVRIEQSGQTVEIPGYNIPGGICQVLLPR